MSASLIIFIVIHVFALAIFVETLRRITSRVREYPLEEGPETLPFGFLRLRYIVIIYILVYIGWVIFSLWIYFIFVDPSFFSMGIERADEMMFDL